MRHFRTIGLLALLLLPAALGACGGLGSSSKPLVLTSFYPLYYLTSQIAGDRAEVREPDPRRDRAARLGAIGAQRRRHQEGQRLHL